MEISQPQNTLYTQVEDALGALPGLANVSVSRGDANGLAYYPADHAASLWYASSALGKNLHVQTFDWDVTFTGLAGPQTLLQVCVVLAHFERNGRGSYEQPLRSAPL